MLRKFTTILLIVFSSLSLARAAETENTRSKGLNSLMTEGGITWIYQSDKELKMVRQLQATMKTHDVSPWLFTKIIIVGQQSIPHSHPALTLNVRNLGNDLPALMTLIHEQMHWYLHDVKPEETEAAMVLLEKQFPDVPGRKGGGAFNAESTRLHLLVNMMTFHAMQQLIGDPDAMNLVKADPIYPWVNLQVQDPKAHGPIMQLMTKAGLPIVP